ncbi:MAG TPA: hypothetical protein VNZ64_01760 [Candidatus Acidoferrum sp.]|jgi:hypothetical protein|nr:hypothetical protein [Candidatus Acidoferrum sp.]
MFRNRHGLSGLLAALLLSALMGQGCASLRPSASMYPPESGGGLEVSDEAEGFLGCLGMALYLAGQWGLAAGACHR